MELQDFILTVWDAPKRKFVYGKLNKTRVMISRAEYDQHQGTLLEMSSGATSETSPPKETKKKGKK